MVRSSHIISACFGAVFCAALLQPWASNPVPSTEPAEHDEAPASESLLLAATAPAWPQGATSIDDTSIPPGTLPTGGYKTAQFTPQMAQNCLEVARMIDPDMAVRLEQLHANDPAQFRVLLATSGGRLLSLAELRERDPKLFGLKMQEMKTDARVMQVGRDLRKAVERADQTAIEALESELEVLLNMQFAFTIAARAEYLMRLERHVEQLKAEIDEMMELHDMLIAERLEELKCGDAPVQPSWQRYSSSYHFATQIDPTSMNRPHPGSVPTNDTADDSVPDE